MLAEGARAIISFELQILNFFQYYFNKLRDEISSTCLLYSSLSKNDCYLIVVFGLNAISKVIDPAKNIGSKSSNMFPSHERL